MMDCGLGPGRGELDAHERSSSGTNTMRSPHTRRRSAACAPARFVTCALVALCASSVARGGEAKESWVAKRLRSLARQLEDADPAMRRSAADAAAQMGEAAARIAPALARALRDEDKEVRWRAANALRRIGPAAVPSLVEALEGEDAELRRSAALALKEIGPPAKEAVPALVRALKRRDHVLQLWALWALGSMGPAAREALPALVRAARRDRVPPYPQFGFAMNRIDPATWKRIKPSLEYRRWHIAADAVWPVDDGDTVRRMVFPSDWIRSSCARDCSKPTWKSSKTDLYLVSAGAGTFRSGGSRRA